jgi:hypothetical protein
VVLVGVSLVGVVGVLAYRLNKISAAKRAAQGVAIAQHRSGETPKMALATAKPRQRPPQAFLPAVPATLAMPSKDSIVGTSPTPESDPIPVFPPGRFVVEGWSAARLVPGANHLVVHTQPPGAQVWVDGEWKGTTPLDLLVGPGHKQLVLAAVGYHLFRENFDAAQGALFRLALAPAAEPVQGDAFLDVGCRTAGRFPIFIDRSEIGLLCPARRVPVPAGTHQVGMYVPKERKLVAVEITVAPGPRPVEVNLE